MDHLDRVREEFTRQADTFTVHAVKADKKMELRFRGAIGDAGDGRILDVARGDSGTRATCCKHYRL